MTDKSTEQLIKKKGMNIQQISGNDEDYKFFDGTVSSELDKAKTLDDEQTFEDNSKEKIIIFDKIQYVRNIRWATCTLSVLNLLIVFGFVFILIYFLFFRNAYFRIEQIQITQPPLDRGIMKLNIIIDVWNPNLQTLNLENVDLSLHLLNSRNQVQGPKFNEKFQNFTQMACSGMSFSTFNVTGYVPLTMEQSSLVLTHQFGFKMSGRIYYGVLGLTQTTQVTKTQFILGN